MDMTVINQSTNAWVAGIHMPRGQSELNLSGSSIQIYASGWGPTNVSIATADTLALYDEGFQIIPGYGLLEAWVLGFSIGFAGFGLVGGVRYLLRLMAHPASPQNL